jgi:hypothetical protein
MRIVSWVVVISSLSALSWLGLSPLLGTVSFPPVEPGQAMGSVATESPRTGRELAQADKPETICQRRKSSDQATDGKTEPAAALRKGSKTATASCTE